MAVYYTRLQEELIPPVVQVVKGFVGVHIVDQHCAVSPPVEGHSQALEPFLPCSVPYLQAEPGGFDALQIVCAGRVDSPSAPALRGPSGCLVLSGCPLMLAMHELKALLCERVPDLQGTKEHLLSTGTPDVGDAGTALGSWQRGLGCKTLLEILQPSGVLHLQAWQGRLPALWILCDAGRADPALTEAVLCRLSGVVAEQR